MVRLGSEWGDVDRRWCRLSALNAAVIHSEVSDHHSSLLKCLLSRLKSITCSDGGVFAIQLASGMLKKNKSTSAALSEIESETETGTSSSVIV